MQARPVERIAKPSVEEFRERYLRRNQPVVITGMMEHWKALSDSAEPCGRKLDFLLQEMNREINTIGAKADGLGVSELIINAKAELERMREQVQNVE